METKTLNKIQALYAELLRVSSYNNMDGQAVYDWLTANPETWTSFMFGRFEYSTLITLRDLNHGFNNADTLYVLCPTAADAQAIIAAAFNDMGADEADAVDHEKACSLLGSYGQTSHNLVRVWWD